MASPQPVKAHAVMRRIPARTLAAVTGQSTAQISRVLNGERRGSIELRLDLAAFLGLPLDELFIDSASS